ncbi:hypothetical protein [Priestia koreensis]|nr:hypothetical protein [Priestia koreensis]
MERISDKKIARISRENVIKLGVGEHLPECFFTANGICRNTTSKIEGIAR